MGQLVPHPEGVEKDLLKHISAELKANGAILFASKREAQRYLELKQLEELGEIESLETQPPYLLAIEGEKIYPRPFKLDFRYKEDGNVIVEDVKGFETREWKGKWNLVKKLYPEVEFRVVK